jgi:GT2 family glycosyltransferase
MGGSRVRADNGISVCIINYNGEWYLEETLTPVWAQRDQFEEILLIDNASEDKSIELVSGLFPTVTIIPLKTNAGPGVARNIGLRKACCHRILMLDNDIRITPGMPARLNQCLDEFPGAALAMPGVRYQDRENTIQFDGAGCHYLGLMILQNQNMPADAASSTVRKIDTLVTSCFMLDRTRMGEDILFDESFFFNYEDFDFGLRTRLLGHEILAVPDVYCFHRGGTPGLSYRPGESYPGKRVHFLIRNRWQVILKCYGLRTMFLLSPVFLVYEVFQFLGIIRKKWFADWFQSICWILSHRDEIMRKRRVVQIKRIRKDAEILQNGPLPFTLDLARSTTEKAAIRTLDCLAAWYWRGIERFI